MVNDADVRQAFRVHEVAHEHEIDFSVVQGRECAPMSRVECVMLKWNNHNAELQFIKRVSVIFHLEKPIHSPAVHHFNHIDEQYGGLTRKVFV